MLLCSSFTSFIDLQLGAVYSALSAGGQFALKQLFALAFDGCMPSPSLSVSVVASTVQCPQSLFFMFLQVIHLEKITSEMGSASQANIRLTALKKTLATGLSPRVLLPAISKTFKQIQKNWKVSVDCWTLEREGGTETLSDHFWEHSIIRFCEGALSSKTRQTFSVFMVESHGPIYEHLARAHWSDEKGRALISPVSADHLFPGSPGLPGTALRGELVPSPHALKLSFLICARAR